MEDKRLSELAEKYLNGATSPAEEAELHAWWDRETNVEEEQVVITAEPETYGSVRDRILHNLNHQIDAEEREKRMGAAEPAYSTNHRTLASGGRIRRMDRRWLLAASVIFAIAALAILIPLSHKQTVLDSDSQISAARNIKPGGNKAILELSDGRNIALDSAREGLLASESGTKVTKVGKDRLDYTTSGNSGVSYNAVRTPKGGQYRLVLPDGSNVWLNAASSIRFPTAFTGSERSVELSGEAYFEVANDPSRPFKVLVSPLPGAPSCEVTALGTNFNINSYGDESSVRATLLKGRVRVESLVNHQSGLLKPGQEAIIGMDHELKVRENPDSDDVIAWREGLFKFKNASIDEIMKQMARWYDVDIVDSGRISEHFVSTLPMDADLFQDLKTLQKTGRVRFRAEGRTITVLPK